jgi:acyl dehydratase
VFGALYIRFSQNNCAEYGAPIILKDVHELRTLVSRELGVTEWFPVTQDRIAQFAAATEDRQWIHVDAARAGVASPYSGTIAHGFLTLSLISHFLFEVVRIEGGVRLAVNYGLNRVRFPAPVRAGSRIRARISLLAFEELTNAVAATYSVTLEIEGVDKPCCAAEWVVRYYF